MVDYLLVVPIVISFLVTLFFLPFWIRKAHQIGLVWRDMNKGDLKPVAGSGGVMTVLAFVLGVLAFVAYRTFIVGSTHYLIEILAMLCVIFFLGGIGLIDDLLGWQHGGLSIRSRIVLVILASIPLVVINAGRSVIAIPFMQTIDVGILYPLLFIPLGIVGAATTFNMIAGFNGLEAGQGMLLLTALGFVAFFTGNSWISVISLCMVASLAAFLLFNFAPARVFPGDSLTYIVGGLFATLAIYGSFERIALLFFLPYIVEVILKVRGWIALGVFPQSFGKPNNKGRLDLKYDKMYSLTHIALYLLNKTKNGATEKRVVYSIWTLQVVMILLGIVISYRGIFG